MRKLDDMIEKAVEKIKEGEAYGALAIVAVVLVLLTVAECFR